MKNCNENTNMRLDKWLWAARFFKTSALAQRHIELRRVQVNGAKVKNSKSISCGDIIDLTLNSLPYKIKVLALNHQRLPEPEARLLYEEDLKTAERREQQSRGYVTPDSFTHGSSAQRMTWFKRGYDSGNINQCNTFNG